MSQLSFAIAAGLGIFLLLFLTSYLTMIAYRHGVRDGYQNTFLPHVQEIVRQEHLLQGERITNETKH